MTSHPEPKAPTSTANIPIKEQTPQKIVLSYSVILTRETTHGTVNTPSGVRPRTHKHDTEKPIHIHMPYKCRQHPILSVAHLHSTHGTRQPDNNQRNQLQIHQSHPEHRTRSRTAA